MLGKQELNPHDPADARAFLEQDERTLKRKVKNVPCPQCGKLFASRYSASQHERDKHHSAEDEQHG